MIKSAYNYPVSQLFDISTNLIYVIPRYQREYTWGKQNWENLFDDLLESDSSYFLGSIICINQSTDALAIQRLEVVDGQQRLTTLSLLFAAVYGVLQEYKEQLDEDQNVELVNLKRKLVLKAGKDDLRVIPQVQNNNLADYRSVLGEIKVIKSDDFPKYAGSRKIVRAYRYFKNRLHTEAQNHQSPVIFLMEFLDKITQASLVKIEVESHTDAYILFESLNNRGVPLTAIDLIKNKLLAKLEQVNPGQIDFYFEQWNKLLGDLGDDYGIQERFFRQYYNAFKNDLKEIYNVPVATRSNLIQVYEKLINYDAEKFLEDLSLAGKKYSLILQPSQDNYHLFGKNIQRLERIQGSPSYLLMLYLFVNQETLHIQDRHLNIILEFLVCFFVRRNLTDTPPTRDLTRLFMAIIDKISDKRGADIFDLIRGELIAISTSDEVFRQKLSSPIYRENYGVTRFVLCTIEEAAMTQETWKDLWKFKGNQFVWTVEHILPQGEKLPESWVQMIANGDIDKARELQETHVHRLGNLTISGYNTTLGNKSFQDKRDRQDRQGNKVGYCNGLSLNADLAEATTWGIPEIEVRTAKLVDQAMELFSLH